MSIAAGDLAPAVICDVGFAREGSRFAVAVGALAVGAHAMAVGPGQATWRRIGGLVEVRSEGLTDGLPLEMHAGLAFTAVSISGGSLPVTAGATLLDPGLLVGLRWHPRARTAGLSPWLDVTGALWPATHTLFVSGSDATGELPFVEAMLGLGVSFGGGDSRGHSQAPEHAGD